MEWCVLHPSQCHVVRVQPVPLVGGSARVNAVSEGSSFELVEEALGDLSLDSASASDAASEISDNYSAPTHANLRALAQSEQPEAVRRMFVCPEHGFFWKKVAPKRNGLCVARCRRCPVVNGVGTRYIAIPAAEERGKGLFECGDCGNVWTSNTACRSLKQYCHAEKCNARKEMRGFLAPRRWVHR